MTDSTITLLMKALRQLENTASIVAKRQLIIKYSNEIPQFKTVLLYALDPYRKFGVARFPSIAADPGEGSWFDIHYFLKAAVLRDSSTQNVGAWLKLVAISLPFAGRELLRRIVLKDLRCGVGATLVNSVIPGLIPEFGCMLATSLEPRHLTKLATYPAVYAQPKLNGDRVVAICAKNTEPEMLSRGGHTLLNYTNIARKLYYLVKKLAPEGMVFDGEMIDRNFFNTRSVKKLAGNEAVDAIYYVFDCVPYGDWRMGVTATYSKRMAMLRLMAEDDDWKVCKELSRVKTQTVTNFTWDAFVSLRDNLISHKYEGLIIRPDLPYNFKTRSSIYKFKKMDTIDCPIVEVLPGETGKKHQFHAGSILVELPNGQTCKAGLKLTEAGRDKLWEKRAKFVGLVAQISYQDKTVNQSGEWKLQFPVYVGLRKDKS